MGAKTWMLVFSNGSIGRALKKDTQIDRKKTTELVEILFSGEKLEGIEDGDLSMTCPPDDIIYAAFKSGVFIIAAKDFKTKYPSQLNPIFLRFEYGDTIHLHTMYSVEDWFGFAIWKNGKLERALSVGPKGGILEDIGNKLSFEIPYWEGEHPAIDPEDQEEGAEQYPLPFHPLELGEAALKNFFGYVLEGVPDPSLLKPYNMPLMGFKRSKQIGS